MSFSPCALAAASSRIMMGICAPDAEAGVASLKAWVTDLGMPKAGGSP